MDFNMATKISRFVKLPLHCIEEGVTHTLHLETKKATSLEAARTYAFQSSLHDHRPGTNDTCTDQQSYLTALFETKFMDVRTRGKPVLIWTKGQGMARALTTRLGHKVLAIEDVLDENCLLLQELVLTQSGIFICTI